MKKSVLISTTLIVLALSATSIYAQVSGSSLITKMKAAAANFTLASELNPGQTGLQSAPVSGKKTGDILTAGEWNRVLELLAEGGSSGSGSGWENVPLTDTADYDTACVYEVQFKTTDSVNNNLLNGDTSWRTGTIRGNKYLGFAFTDGSATAYSVWGVPSSSKSTYGYRDSAGTFVPSSDVSILGMRRLCGGGGSGGGSGWVDVPLTDTADFDKACEYRFYMNAMGLDAIYYVNAVAPTTLIYISHNSVISSIPSNNKTSYQVNGSPAFTVSKIEKLCGGGVGGASGGSIRPSSIDSSDRGPATFLAAFNQCKSEGKYLPTAEEALYFVFGGAGTYQNPSSNPLWTITPDDSRNAFITVYSNSNVGLNGSGGMDRTGADTPYSTTATAHYRCVSEGGSGSSSGWVDIVLQGATPFNVNCEYRFKASAPGNTDDDAFIGDDNAYNYIQRVHANRLTYQHIGTSYEHINADTKTTLRQNGTPTSPAQTITQIQQRCD